MSHVHRWTGYPFLPDPALFLQQFRSGDPTIIRMLFFHFYPGLCFFAEKLTGDTAMAQQIAEECLGSAWQQRQNFNQPQEIKQFLYIRTYQACNRFTQTVSKTEETLISVISAELFSYLDERPGAPEWLQQRLSLLPLPPP